MTVDDLMTLFALFTLTVQYHEHHQEDYQMNARQVPNKTPLYITDILALRGKKDSGPARDSIRESIDRIEYTDFQLHELTGRWMSENMPEGFKSDRFRFLPELSLHRKKHLQRTLRAKYALNRTYTSWFGSHRSMKSSSLAIISSCSRRKFFANIPLFSSCIRSSVAACHAGLPIPCS